MAFDDGAQDNNKRCVHSAWSSPNSMTQVSRSQRLRGNERGVHGDLHCALPRRTLRPPPPRFATCPLTLRRSADFSLFCSALARRPCCHGSVPPCSCVSALPGAPLSTGFIVIPLIPSLSMQSPSEGRAFMKHYDPSLGVQGYSPYLGKKKFTIFSFHPRRASAAGRLR